MNIIQNYLDDMQRAGFTPDLEDVFAVVPRQAGGYWLIIGSQEDDESYAVTHFDRGDYPGVPDDDGIRTLALAFRYLADIMAKEGA